MTYPEKCIARAEKATKGPLFAIVCTSMTAITQARDLSEPVIAEVKKKEDAQFFAHARQDVPELAKRLQRAIDWIADKGCYCDHRGQCDPCKTVKELERSPEET